MRSRFYLPGFIALIISICSGLGLSIAQSTPQTIKVQGFLSDTSGGSSVPATGSFSMIFDLYDASLGGSVLQSVGPVSVDVTDGLYAVDLPFVESDFEGAQRWIEITVAGETLSPRIQLVSTPFAYVAEQLDGFEGTDLEESSEIAAGDANLQTQVDVLDTRVSALEASGGNTLDQAYDEGGSGAGRVIIADSGPVEIQGAGGLKSDVVVAGDPAAPETQNSVEVFTRDRGFHVRSVDPVAPPTLAQSFEGLLDKGTLEVGDRNRVRLGFVANGGADPRFYVAMEGVVEDPAGDTRAAGIRFSTHDGPVPEEIERMRITAGGRIGIGTTSPNHPLEMASGAHVTASGVWTNASSREYKDNIRDLGLQEAVAALEELRPRKFSYRVDSEDDLVGFIAEEVPELVATPERNGLSAMDIVGVLTKVVQAQREQILELRDELDQLKELVALQAASAAPNRSPE